MTFFPLRWKYYKGYFHLIFFATKGEKTLTDRFSLSAQKILGLSLAFAREFGHTYIGSEHFLLAFLSDKNSRHEKLLSEAGASLEKTKTHLTHTAGKGDRSADCVTEISPTAKRIIENSSRSAEKEGRYEVSADDLFFALISEKSSTCARLLEMQGCRLGDIIKEHKERFYSDGSEIAKGQKKNRKSDERLPSLQKFAQNITEKAKNGEFDPLIGRDDETKRLMRILMRRTKNNPCLIGDPGVGKTAIVEGLAKRIADGDVPRELEDAQIYSLDLPSMLAGAKYRGDFEERMKLVVDEVSKNPSVILFIDEIHTIIGAGSAEGAIDGANIIKPALARGKIKVIGATTLEEYRRHIEKDAAFERRFQSVNVREPSIEQSIVMIKGLRRRYEKHHGVIISDNAIEAAVKLSHTYLNDRFLPDKAIDLLDESAARIKLESRSPSDSEKVLRLAMGESVSRFSADENKSLGSLPQISEEDIAQTLTEWTGIPLRKLCSGEEKKLSELEDIIRSRLIGQDEALERVCSVIRRSKTSMRDPSRPLASFIFTGPSGVGKTELAKALAQALYGSENALLRLDMSEYSEPHSVSRLIGSPPGYIGYEDGGQLSEKVRRNPHHIILFDEIEKAHKDIFSLLLQIMEEGELSDSHGRKINFRSSVIIMTSNVGADLSLSGTNSGKVGFLSSNYGSGERIYERLREVFSPEFLGRPDDIILFKALEHSSALKICERMLFLLKERLESNGCSVEFSDSIPYFIVSSCKMQGGARDIRKNIGQLIEAPLSLFLLRKKLETGETLYISSDKNGIAFTKTTQANFK